MKKKGTLSPVHAVLSDAITALHNKDFSGAQALINQLQVPIQRPPLINRLYHYASSLFFPPGFYDSWQRPSQRDEIMLLLSMHGSHLGLSFAQTALILGDDIALNLFELYSQQHVHAT